MHIEYMSTVELLKPEHLRGFFVGWPEHPAPAEHVGILRRSYAAWMAMDGEQCVGFVNALSDGMFYAFMPLLEVLPEYQGQGIGTELLTRMLRTLEGMYAVDVVCDEAVASFYEPFDFQRCAGLVRRRRWVAPES